MAMRADRGDGVWEQRVDRGSLRSPRVKPDGTMLVEGYPVKEGVLTYRRNGRTVREYVPASTLEASAIGLGRLPVTLEHPVEHGVVVNVRPDNVQQYQVGDTDGTVVVEDDGFVRVQMAIRRSDAIQAVRAGKQELSALYDAQMDWTAGVHPVHGAYDGTQIGREYNSIAITDRGRAGRDARLRADGAETVDVIVRRADSAPATLTLTKGATVNPRFLRLLTLLGVTSRVDSDDAAIEASCGALEQRRADSATAETAAATKLATETARADSEKARADAAEAKLLQLQTAETARADAAERTGLDALAKTLGVDPAKHADAKDLRKAIATAHLGELRADADDAYIRAVCDIAAKGSQKGAGRVAGIEAWVPGNAGGGNGGTTGAGVTRSDSTPRKSSRDRYYDSLGLGKKAQDTQGGGR